jgi:predicted MFS family arabinose efflux permease
VREDGGYGAVLAERPIRRLLLASLAGRVAFSMLPLGFVVFAAAETGSTATAGALVAAFTAASALAPVRGRIVDRHGPAALGAFAFACSAGLVALVLVAALDAPRAVLVAVSALSGLMLPPLGPFTRAVWGLALRERDAVLRRTYALDSAGEEAALVVAPLLVALAIAFASPRLALLTAAVGLLAGTLAAGRSRLAAGVAPVPAPPRSQAGLPAAVWLAIASLVPVAAALGAIEVAVPAAARERGSLTSAGLLLAAMAVGTVCGSLLAGRRARRWPAERRVIFLQLVMAAGVALAAAASGDLWLLGAALVVPGAALGALFATLYLLVDQRAPRGAGTRTFAWLVTANNGGIAAGAAVAGTVSEESGPTAGLWFGAVCAAMAAAPAAAAALMSERGPKAPQTAGAAGVPSGKRRICARQGNDDTREGS